LQVNITGVFMTAQAVAKEMIRWGNGGSIAMIASMSGTVANKVCFFHASVICTIIVWTGWLKILYAQGLICPAYNASKAGVIQLGRNLAAEWGQFGIRVNTLSPGYIVTAMVEALFEQYPERRKDWPTQNMLGKLSKPEEYRGAAVFLISDASSFMTGSDLRIDGGHAAWWFLLYSGTLWAFRRISRACSDLPYLSDLAWRWWKSVQTFACGIDMLRAEISPWYAKHIFLMSVKRLICSCAWLPLPPSLLSALKSSLPTCVIAPIQTQ